MTSGNHTPTVPLDAALSFGLDELLTELRLRNWTLLRWGPADAPQLLAALFHWQRCTDVLILRSETDATGFRTPDRDTLHPRSVTYQYHSCALWTLRALLSLPAPGPYPPAAEFPEPRCHIPPNLPNPLAIRPLRP